MSGKNERFGSRVFVHVDINADQYDFFFCDRDKLDEPKKSQRFRLP